MEVPQNFVDWLLAILTGMIGYVWIDNNKKIEKLETAQNADYDKIMDRQKDIEAALSAHRESSAEKFVTRAEVKQELSEIKQTLLQISNKIDSKADKP